MLNVILLEYTPNGEKLVATAAKQCYEEGFVGDNYDEITSVQDYKRIRHCIAHGHTSVLEHASYTFAITGISRACSHQLVRFRIAAFSQQSQRYCTAKNKFPYITPMAIARNNDFHEEYKELMKSVDDFYHRMVSAGIPAEDARFILPNAAETSLIMTMNARELHHAMRLRCCTHAQWEIRNLFNEIKRLVKSVHPTIFENSGAQCDINGTCNEGKRSCGKV